MLRRSLVLLSLVGFTGCNCGGGGGAQLPTGFSTAVAMSSVSDGKMLSLVLDADDAPMLAYMNQTGTNPENWAVLFTRWDSATGGWTTPVVVADQLGVISDNPTRIAASLARDPKDGRLGVAFLKTEAFCGDPGGNKDTTVHVAFSSDQGKTWSASERVSEAHYTRNDPINGVEVCSAQQPRLAMRDGTVHLAWAENAGEAESATNFLRGYYYASSTAAGAWSRTLLPHAGDDARRGTKGVLSLALDSSGAPAVAYLMGAISGHATPNMDAVLFVRPGSAAVRAGDSNNVQNDSPQLALAFDGTKPRIAVHLMRASGQAGANANWVLASNDGAAFTASQLPDDAKDQGAQYLDLGFAAGQGAVVYEFASANGDGVCGGPKLGRSTDGTTWTTCGLDTQTRQFLGDYVTAELTRAGKLIAAFREDTADSAGRFQPGLVLYVEP